jgi:hypothetical protein
MVKRAEASCLIRLFALFGAWVDPSVGCNRSVEVGRSSEDVRRLSATLAVTTFGQLVSANLRQRVERGSDYWFGTDAGAALARLGS